jgi:outer membrane protein
MRYLYATLLFVSICATGAAAQDAAATPTPAPTPRLISSAPENVPDVPAIAPNYRSERRALPDLGRPGVDTARQRPLTLADAIELALENNRDIEISRKGTRIAEFDLRAARGFYQPRLTGTTLYERSTVANVSIFSSNPTTTTSAIVGNAGVTGYIPRFGTVLRGDFNNTRLTSNNPISILSPQFNSNLGFTLTQPLFRGRRFDVPRRNIEIAKANLDLTDAQFRQRTIEVVAQVQRAYWDLTFALRNLQVQRDSVRDARRQLEHNRRLVEEGQLAPIDIVAAETQVANIEQAVYEALNVVNLAENALKAALAPSRRDALWNEAITPVEPVDLSVPDPTITEATELAIANRPELAINSTQRSINQIDQRLYRDQRKPQIDLVASYTGSGVGGSQNPNFNPTFPTACTINPTSPGCQQQQANLASLTGSPFTDLLANRYPTYRVGVNFNLPLFGDKTAAAQLGRSIVEGERIEVQREQIEQAIEVEVRNAIQAIRVRTAQLRSAAIARENSERQYESEQRRLDEGQSDTFRVLERQTALTIARSNELRARIELNKAIAELERATGNTLKANDIEVRK